MLCGRRHACLQGFLCHFVVMGTALTDVTAAVASRLLAAPHPLVAAAAGVWRREDARTEALSRWLASLPGTVDTGALTDQASAE